MRELIQKYLLQHSTVSIEGWGSMCLTNQAAILDFPNRLIHAPSITIDFKAQSDSSHSFLNWLTAELNILPEEAAHQVGAYVQWFNHTILQQEITWSGWGQFSYNGSQVLFTAEHSKLLPGSIITEKVLGKGANNFIRVGENEKSVTEMEEWLHTPVTKKIALWQVIALVISVVGITFTIVFVNEHNIRWKNHTNNQRLHLKDSPVLYKNK